MAQTRLKPDDREFLALVSEAAFANPFSDRRADLDRLILGGKEGRWPDIVPQVLEQVRARLAAMDRVRPVHVQDFPDRDRVLMISVFLFDCFHRHGEDFDGVIASQTQSPNESITVPFAGDAIGLLIRRGLGQAQAVRLFSLLYQVRRAYHFIDRGLVGASPCMQRFREDLWNVIFTCDIQLYEAVLWDRLEDFSVLLLGPTGAGKGAAAAAIGRSGFIPFDPDKRHFAKAFTRTFVAVNLSQYVETLLESELFGHTKGAFTGAVAQHEGLLSLCGRHGSIFLDEVGDISPAIQIKLLKVLEERTFNPIGSHEPRRFEGRVIAATHRSLDALRQQGRFRDDFFYRLCSDCIEVPSLRRRIQEDPAELDAMIRHTVQRILGRDDADLCTIAGKVIRQRLGPDYPWPGNVRELAQCVRRIILKRDCATDLVAAQSDPRDLADQIRAGQLTVADLTRQYCRHLYERLGTYEEVARRTDLDRRTVRRYIGHAFRLPQMPSR